MALSHVPLKLTVIEGVIFITEAGTEDGGQGRIRTSVTRKEWQIYSLLPLTTRPPVLSAQYSKRGISRPKKAPVFRPGLKKGKRKPAWRQAGWKNNIQAIDPILSRTTPGSY